jgi:hypothetical protein
MGLLDDAIREHLELKRRRGADPGEVAREEHEALDPPGGSRAPDAQTAVAPDSPFPEDPELEESLASASPHESQETEELDMKSLLEDEPVAIPDDRDPAGDFMGAAGDALEWHSPQDDAPAPQAAAQGASAQAGRGETSDEDVLEETPEFLRETPDQDRLWFEQRPPRDFDFDG